MIVRTEAENKKRMLGSRVIDHFNVYGERRGTPQYIKPVKRLFDGWGLRSAKKKFVIDFVLEPKESALAAGWELGCVGIEAKQSPLVGSKFGKAVSQILDYQTAKFDLAPNLEACELSMIFLLGPDRFHGTEASILMQEGIGLLKISDFEAEVKFLHGNGSHPILTLRDGLVEYRRPQFGMGSGHR